MKNLFKKLKNNLHLVLILSLAATQVTFLGCTKNHNHESAGGSESIKSQKSYWTCSMHPQIHKDGPGKCPICGMDLIEVKPEAQAQQTTQESAASASSSVATLSNFPKGHGQITLTREKQELIGIKQGEVISKELFKSIDTAGRVAFDPELFVAQNEYVEAIKQEESVKNSPVSEVKHSAMAMVESSKTRLKILGLSDSQISELKDTSKNSYLIPKSGDKVWIYAEVYEIDLPYIKAKLTAKISGRALGGKVINGEVISVDRVINTTTRTAKVRIALNNAPMELRPESYVDVSILSPLGKQTVVPFDSILDTGNAAWVYVIKNSQNNDGNIIEPRKVIIKSYAGDEVAIASGVLPGDKIVTSANFLVDSESRLLGTREDFNKTDNLENSKKTIKKTPQCPDGKKWHEQMNHCM